MNKMEQNPDGINIKQMVNYNPTVLIIILWVVRAAQVLDPWGC